jgi:hypothetical protein
MSAPVLPIVAACTKCGQQFVAPPLRKPRLTSLGRFRGLVERPREWKCFRCRGRVVMLQSSVGQTDGVPA